MPALLLALTALGIGIDATGRVKAGKAAKQIGQLNARSITQTAELNASLIEEGSELNAGTFAYNAAALEYQGIDAVERGREQEELFRKQLRGFIGSQRASYAAQGVEIGEGSPLEVQMDTARQGELDALTIRVSAAREAWGFQTAAQGERLQARATRKLGTLQARNVRETGRAESLNARLGGNYAAAAQNWGAASSIVGGSATLLRTKYGYR